MCLFFFFQAEDGIRDADVTGVQTCALPISAVVAGAAEEHVVTGDGEARLLLDALQSRLEALVRERLDAAALVADEVMMVLGGELDAFVMRAPVAKIDLLHEPLLGQQVDDAIDARDSD